MIVGDTAINRVDLGFVRGPAAIMIQSPTLVPSRRGDAMLPTPISRKSFRDRLPGGVSPRLPPGALTTISGEIARDDQHSFLERADEILDTIEARPSLALLPDRKGSPADVPGVANSGARWRGTNNSLPLTGPIQTGIANDRCGD